MDRSGDRLFRGQVILITVVAQPFVVWRFDPSLEWKRKDRGFGQRICTDTATQPCFEVSPLVAWTRTLLQAQRPSWHANVNAWPFSRTCHLPCLFVAPCSKAVSGAVSGSRASPACCASRVELATDLRPTPPQPILLSSISLKRCTNGRTKKNK